MALPHRTTGSLSPTFVPARLVSLAVKLPYAFTLYARFPSALREPLGASVTLLEATAPVKLPARHCPDSSIYRLEIQCNKSGISRMAPPKLAFQLQSLPPILHILNQISVPGYSEGSRGLSVHMQVSRIFTGTTISPSLLLRQWGGRYTIRAGRNLPDKEFRYLRTVIVTAAVYRGFNSELRTRRS